MGFLDNLAARNGFLPHGYCFQWDTGLLWSLVGSDTLIGLAYFSIPLVIVRFVRRRPEVNLGGLGWLFGVFIFACGLTHFIDVLTIWQPDYLLQAWTKAFTALASISTAAIAWRLLPRALQVPSAAELGAALKALQSEVDLRRDAEGNLQEIEQSLATTLAIADAGFITTDHLGSVTRMNAVAERITGWVAASAVRQPIGQVFACEGEAHELLRRGPIFGLAEEPRRGLVRTTAVCIARDGRHTRVELNLELTRHPDGRIRGMTMVIRDIERLSQIEDALRRSQDRLRFALDSAGIGDWELDLDSGEITRSKRCDQCFGHVTVPARWTRDDFAACIHEDDREATLASLAEAERSGMSWHAEFRSRWPDASVHWLRMDGRVGVSDGEGNRLIGTVSDVTEARLSEDMRRQAQALEAENRRTQEASRLKSLFLANMSHELRTPLNGVIGFADLLRAGVVPHDSPKHAEYLELISQCGKHLLQMINDVLDLSKIEAGRLEFSPVAVDLPGFVDEVAGTFGLQLRERRLQLRSTIDNDLRTVFLDRVRLKQVLFNYLSNAIKFTNEGGRIEVRAFRLGDRFWRLEVEDTGIGIDAEHLSSLFTEFKQLDSTLSKRHQGTGLGLALTRRLVEAQGGRVGVRSSPGVGSTFFAVLPRRHDELAGDSDDLPRMLLALHHEETRDRVVNALAVEGMLADEASSAAEVVLLGRVRRYGALAIELSEADCSALTALAELRAGGLSSAAPVRVLGASAGADGGIAFAITELLAKPLKSQDLKRALAALRRQLANPRPILVVDDEQAARELMSAALAAEGFEAVCVASGADALERLDEIRPGAMILDLMMPGLDGFHVLDTLRHTPAWRDLPVIVWTALALSDDECKRLLVSARTIAARQDQNVAGVIRDAFLDWARESPAADIAST